MSKGGSRVDELAAEELERLREKVATEGANRWNADPEDVQRALAKLVLTLIEFLRRLLERQAIRRMDNGTLTPEEIERIGVALMKLEETVNALAETFGIDPEDLTLDLGPLGRLY